MTYNVDQFKSLVSTSGGFARTNLYAVQLPSLEIDGRAIIPTEELNVLCKGTQLPGRQLNSVERTIGIRTTKVAYGYQVEDLTLTFQVMNDYKIKKYFDEWQRRAVDPYTGDIGYYNDYTRDVQIHQLRKGLSVPLYKDNIDFLDKVPSNIKNRLPKLPGIFGDIIDLQQGQIDLAIITKEMVMYEVNLADAYPTSVAAISLSNEQDGLVELSVQLSYKNWTDRAKVLEEDATGSFLSSILTKINVF